MQSRFHALIDVICGMTGLGATIKAIMKATGWQQHSVRGFFAGMLRKKSKLNLVSEGSGETRVYRIVNKVPSHKKKTGGRGA